MNLLLFIFGCALVENLFFGKLCAGTISNENAGVKYAALLGLWTLIVTAAAALISGLIDLWILTPLNVGILRILVLPALVLIAAQALRCALRDKAAIDAMWLPVVISGIMVGFAAPYGAGYGLDLLAAIFTAVGYLIVLVLTAGIRDRIAYNNFPKCMKGLPISLITAGLMVLAFMGFTGLA